MKHYAPVRSFSTATRTITQTHRFSITLIIDPGSGIEEQQHLWRKPGMKVTIKRWNAVAVWKWNIPDDDVCGICQNQFDGTCPTCRYPGDECKLLSGKCGHNFHMHCILEWVKQDSAKGQCPMCRQTFEWIDGQNMTAAAEA